MIKTIGVIGATGMIGLPVTKALANAGFKVHALVRDMTKAKSILPAEINLIQGDLTNAASLQNFISNVDALYLNLNLKPSERPGDFHSEKEGLENVIRISKNYPIQRIGFISSLVMQYQGMNNFNWWVFDIKQNAVRQIKESGIPYTIFYPSTFMENFDGNYRRGNRMLLAGKSVHKMFFISADDYGKQVAAAFQLPGNENKEFVIQGPEAFTADEAVIEYVRYYKKEKLSIAKAPLGLLKMMSAILYDLKYGWRIIEALNNYPEKFEAENTWRELGKPEITIRKFAEQKNQVALRKNQH